MREARECCAKLSDGNLKDSLQREEELGHSRRLPQSAPNLPLRVVTVPLSD